MVCRWADDSQRLILEHFDTIYNSPSKIYHQALPFSPSKSWLRNCYNTELSHAVQVVKGLQNEWGTCSRTVPLDDWPQVLTCTKDLIVVGFYSGNITILDAITGIHISALPGHNLRVDSLALSLDKTFLVSGGADKVVKLWDIQTGGIAKIFCGHTDWVYSTAISPDQSTIASGSRDKTIRLWNAQTGDCYCVLKRHSSVNYISFSPSNARLLMTACNDNTIQQWDINGNQIGPAYEGENFVFSPDGTCFVSWGGAVATISASDSGLVIAKLQAIEDTFEYCCFSPDGKSMAGADGCIIYIWNITSSDPYLVEALVGHTGDITSLAFSSSLISSSRDKSIKFWQSGTSSTDLATTDPEPISFASASIVSVSLQANDGIALSYNSDGVVEAWDISTGLCKTSFHLPLEFASRSGMDPQAKSTSKSSMQLVNGRLVVVLPLSWGDLQIWDSKRGYTRTVYAPCRNLRISGDGSKVFLLGYGSIEAWSIQPENIMSMVQSQELQNTLNCDFLTVNGSEVWVSVGDSQIEGWDFGGPDPKPIPLSDISPARPHLKFIDATKEGNPSPSRIEDQATGKEVFQLLGKYANPTVTQLDGQYLVAGYDSGEVLILDFSQVSL